MPSPWSSSGSLVSDRIRPNLPLAKQQELKKGKGKGNAPTPEPHRSKAVRALEARLDGARGSNSRAKDPKGGCFCQARNHALSSYVPMCRNCGLILCTFNPPYLACPHCSSPLLDEREREALVVRLEVELVELVEKEEEERQRAIEDARAAEGAFPMLAGSQTVKASRTPSPSTATHTVLSLNSQTKKVTVSSYNTPTRTPSRPASRVADREDEGRVPGPSAEVSYVTEPVDVDAGRPWRIARAVDVKYVPLLRETLGHKRKKVGDGGARAATGAAN